MGRKKLGRSGASMMEIMIALVVAAALSAVAAPNWQKAADKKRADRALAALMTISECIKQYKVEYRLGVLNNMKYSNLENYGCINPNDYPQGFQFAAMRAQSIPNTDPPPALVVKSNDNSRMVCVTSVGNLNASAAVYFIDAPGSGTCNDTYTGYYRRISEDTIGKQRGS